MAASETVIANLALYRMGQSTIDDIDGTDVLSVKVNAMYDQARDELMVEGPELGWKFARRRYSEIDDEKITVTDIDALVAGSTMTVTATDHTLVAGDLVELDSDTGYGGTYEVISVTGTTSFVVAETFVATGTGYCYWRSNEYSYRYLIPTTPTVLRVVSVRVGGVELSDWLQEGGYILTNQESDEVDMTIVQQITTTTKFPTLFTKALVLLLAIKLHYNITQDLKAIQFLYQEYDLAISKAIAMDERGKYVKESSKSWQEVGNTQEVE